MNYVPRRLRYQRDPLPPYYTTQTHTPTPVLMCYGEEPISALGDLSCVSTDSGTMLPAAQGWNLGEEYCFDVGLGHSCPNRPTTPKGRGHPRKQRVSLCGFSTPHQEAQRIKIQRAQKQKKYYSSLSSYGSVNVFQILTFTTVSKMKSPASSDKGGGENA